MKSIFGVCKKLARKIVKVKISKALSRISLKKSKLQSKIFNKTDVHVFLFDLLFNLFFSEKSENI